jgi:hypothetical protein
MQPIVVPGGADDDLTAGAMRCDAVPDRVFNDGLENELRHGRIENRRRCFNAIFQPISESHLHNRQIMAKEFELLPQTNFLLVRVAQSHA